MQPQPGRIPLPASDAIGRPLVCLRIRQGRKVLIAAHGNSLRALVKYLDGIPESAIVDLGLV
jgi:bisphosphoglycerate-dependent phosphoglycerate mutase